MRVHFNLKNYEAMTFTVDGKTYSYPQTPRLAFKPNHAANIEEVLLQTPDNKKVWLTVVGEDAEPSGAGILRGWYVAKVLDDESAADLVKAFSLWAQDLR